MLRLYGPARIFTASMSLTTVLMSAGRLTYQDPRVMVFSGKNEFLNKNGSVSRRYTKQEPEVDSPFRFGGYVSTRDLRQELTKAWGHQLYGGRWGQLYLIGLIIFRILPDV